MREMRVKQLRAFELYCTECDWKKVVQVPEVVEWHLKRCPDCGKSVIVTDENITEYHRIVEENIRAFGRTEKDNL